MIHQTLFSRAIEVLEGNWKQGFTIPTSRLYPFQWNWDSGFTSLGWAHVDAHKAMAELRNLFSGQWANGMVPHIIFHSENETTYFPNHPFWATSCNPGAPQKPKTSGITQPPVHGFILEALHDLHPQNKDVAAFIKELYSKVLASHRFFYTYRDPEGEGLAFIYHPWESGRDNSPLWDACLGRINISKEDIPVYERQDNKIGNAAERPTDADYDRYVYLLELGKKYAYEGNGIFETSPFLIQDTLINAILIRSNESLIRLGKMLNIDTSEAEGWQTQSIPAFQKKLWNEALGIFTPFDLRQNRQISHIEVGGWTSLYAGVATTPQALRMQQYLENLNQDGYLLCPSFDVCDSKFDSRRYWRGPIWPQMNWLVYKGLQRYGMQKTAALVRDNILYLVQYLGFYEYFEPQKAVAKNLSKGYGGNHFSWTASTIIDLISES